MKKLFVLLLTFGVVSCENTGNEPEPVLPALIINEVYAVEGNEWIEILNLSDGRIDMGGIKVVCKGTDDDTDITLATVPQGVSVDAGAYYVFDRADGSLNTGFDADKSLVLILVTAKDEELSVFDRDRKVGAGRTHLKSGSYSRLPDASDMWAITATSTKGAENLMTEAPLPSLVINEVYAVEGSEWIEILNASEDDVDMGGMRIVYKSPGSGKDITLAAVSGGISIAAGAYYVFDRSDNTLGSGFPMDMPLVLRLVTAKDKELSIFDRDVDVGVDKKHPAQGSYSRFPDGSGAWIITTTITKAAENKKTQPPPLREIENAIWMWSEHFSSADFNTLAGYGIKHVIVHEAAIADKGETAFKSRVDAARAAGVNIHVWFVCFKPASGWVNPINVETKQFNQAYFDELIDRAKRYAAFGNIAGIHLDYVRYSGVGANKASEHNYSKEVNSTAAIAEFCRQMSVAVKGIDPAIRLSAALMNEYQNDANIIYYGQNTKMMAQYVDIIIPMVYRYPSFSDNWVFNTTKWFADEAKKGRAETEVWAGVTTYSSDNPIVRLSPTQLERDCGLTIRKNAVDSGSTGIVLFRYSLVNYFDMTSDYYYYY